MKVNRKITRLAASMLATAMVASAAALPAMADGDETATPTPSPQVQEPVGDAETLDEIVIQKELQKPANVYAPNVTFNFTVKPVDAPTEYPYIQEGELIPDETASGKLESGSEVTDLAVYRGVTGGIYINKQESPVTDGIATFEPDADNSDGFTDIGKELVTANFTFSINPSAFPHAGVYKYVVTETDNGTDGNYQGITYDSDETRYLYVYVENVEGKNERQVVGAVVKAEKESNKDKTDRFTNTYLENGTPDIPDDDPLHELYITKNVEGALGSLTEKFAFDITIGTSGTGEKYYAVIENKTEGAPGVADTWTPSNADADKYTFIAGENKEIKLKDNQRLHIYGLTPADNYSINEKDAHKNGYTTSVAINHQNEDTVTDKDAQGEAKVEGHVSSTATPKVTKDITYTNTRNSVTPTGVIMNVAPYVLMVVIAAAGCFVFLRKRRDD